MSTLRYVPAAELERLRGLEGDPVARAAAFADACRVNTLYMVAAAGSGHLGTSFSCMDVLAWLHLEVLGEDDLYFSSKGHDAPALYSVLIGLGALDFDKLHRLRRLGGLPGHPDVLTTPLVHTNTGSLGMGISKAKGFVLADRLAGRRRDVWVLTGDGELQEGQFWESLAGAANRELGEITVIVDHNKIQSDTWVADVSDLGDLEGKVARFGWATGRCDGNDVGALAGAIDELRAGAPDRPKLLIADTVKGSGVSFMEPHELVRGGGGLYGFHSGAPTPEDYARGLDELLERLNARLDGLGAAPVELEEVDAPRRSAPARPQRLVAAYGDALVRAAEDDERVVALDADLVLDTGLVPFTKRFPERFVECGIAEQDMVSQAGTLALSGLVPVVHSFACFLTPRANEQIYNNATEGTKVVYVGSLAGLVPGGPGHSHQSVRDISAMGAMPGMALLEPATEEQAALAIRWAVEEADGPVYIRLVSVPWDLGFDHPASDRLERGRGQLVREGEDVLIVGYGPVMLSQAWAAADRLERDGIRVAIASVPWLRDLDGAWLAQCAGDAPVVALDNHYPDGGQGDAVLRALTSVEAGGSRRVIRIGVDRVPECGANDEVLAAHRLDADSLAERVAAAVRTPA